MPVIGGLRGKVLQEVFTIAAAKASTTANIPSDNTIPQISEGTEFMSRTITPIRADSKLLIQVNANICNAGTTDDFCMALFEAGSANALSVAMNRNLNEGGQLVIQHIYWVASTATLTFSVRYGSATSGTTYLNQRASNAGPAMVRSMISIQEIAP